VSIIDQHFRASPALGISMRNSSALAGPEKPPCAAQRTGWLEAGKKLAERIPSSVVALCSVERSPMKQDAQRSRKYRWPMEAIATA
jgi:hypothetical protein